MAILLGSFFLFTFLVAFFTWKKTRSDSTDCSDGYFLAGRSLTGPVIAGSLMLTNLSTEQLVGLNGVSFKEGFVCMAWETLASLSLVLMALIFLPRYLKSGLTTIPQYLEDRYDRSTRIMCNVLFLSGYLVILLPTVLYSGAVAISDIFQVPQLFGVDYVSSIWISVWCLGLIGSCYAIFGGLKSVAISDSINGLGLLIGGTMIPLFGLSAIGDGSILVGLQKLYASKPEMFNAIGRSDQSVPFATLFTGMMLVNTFYWCTNQAIVQRTLGASSLQEGQKGVLFAASLKLLGPVLLVLPGVIAFQLFGDQLPSGDRAYPSLVQAVLPKWLTGFFGAVLFGAILSSFNSALNSAATLFSKGVYGSYLKPESSEKEQVRAGKLFSLVIAILSMAGAPLIMNAPDGLFAYLQEVNGCYSIPILTILLVGMSTKRVPPMAAKLGLAFGVCMYITTQFVLKVDLHFLHVMAILFVCNVILMLAVGAFSPLKEPREIIERDLVDLKPWPHAKPVSLIVTTLAITSYMFFSPLDPKWLALPAVLLLVSIAWVMRIKGDNSTSLTA